MLKRLFLRMQPYRQRGIGLVETLVAVAILGTSVVAFVSALSAGSLSANELNRETIAQSLAQTQMEYTKSYAFASGVSTYPVLSVPASYSVTVSVASVPGGDANIQKITVNVLKNSVSVLTISDYKVNR